jgi:hypothetical protein
MAEGMDSTEAMALMGIMDTAGGMDSTSTMDAMDGMVSTMVSTGIVDSTAVSVSGRHLSSRLIGDATHTTRHLPGTPSRLRTGTTAPTHKATTHMSPTAGPLGCQSSRTGRLHKPTRRRTMRFKQWALIGGGLLGGCATESSGPGVLVLPEAGKTFEQFREEDAVCRNYAQDWVGTTPEQEADDSVARSAGTGAPWGGASDALIGAGSHDAGVGAGNGAAAGSAAAGTMADAVQARYDISYLRCMDAKGNRVPPPPGPPGYPLPPPPHPGANLPPPPR